ncbi:MAG: metallophosphoesterase [Kiritimatiellae bacterium]|nr:metallophosphoesterase [Kiritimatiellia bacterium]
MNRRTFIASSSMALLFPKVLKAAELAAPAEPKPEGPGSVFCGRPYVQLMGADAIGIVWMTMGKATGYVTWSQDDGATWTRAWHGADGLLDANDAIHRAVVTGLNPAKPVRWRIHSRLFENFGPYKVSYRGEEERLEGTIRAILPRRDAVSFAMFNDVHQTLSIYPKLLPYLKDPVTFTVFNGDILNHVENEAAVVTFLLSPLAQVTETTGAPCWYLRGNHETRGAYARHLRDYLALVEGHYYGAVTLGPARIVFVDTGEDKRDDHAEYSGLVDFDGYLAAQTAWLKAETEGEAWRSAKFRIVVEHIPATTGAYNPGVERLRKLQEVLKTAKVSAMFAAHLHRRGWHDPIPERPYPMIVGGGPYPEPKNPIHSATLTRCDIEGDTMRISQFDVTGTKVVDKTFTS